MNSCKLCLGTGWVEEDYHRNKRCPECNSSKVIYDWFNETEYQVSLTKNNRGNISGVLIAEDGISYTVTGENELFILKTLKDMSEGNYS